MLRSTKNWFDTAAYLRNPILKRVRSLTELRSSPSLAPESGPLLIQGDFHDVERRIALAMRMHQHYIKPLCPPVKVDASVS